MPRGHKPKGSPPECVAENVLRPVGRDLRPSWPPESNAEKATGRRRSSLSPKEALAPEQLISPSLPLDHRKRTLEEEDYTANGGQTERPLKRYRPSLHDFSRTQSSDREAFNSLSASQRVHISHWANEGHSWPEEYFRDNTHHIVFRRKRSGNSRVTSVTPSDQRSREEKSASYKNPGYRFLLEDKGGLYMNESTHGITDASKSLCRNLLEGKYATPKDTVFEDKAFARACKNVEDRNDARVILDFTRLLVPSAESLAILSDERLSVLAESVYESWDNCVPATNPRPQPVHAVGFGRSAFSRDQLRKLGCSLGDPNYLSRFMATYYMYFPFLTCEVTNLLVDLNVLDRQNAHSMAVAVRGIVELFRLGKKERDLHGELLTFSVSHDHRTVRLYGYYPIFDGDTVSIYRHDIHSFDITALNGKEKWKTYQFTVGVYVYSLGLIGKIRSIIDGLPSDFNVKNF